MSHRVLLRRSPASTLLSCTRARHVPISIFFTTSLRPHNPQIQIPLTQERNAHTRPPRLARSNRNAIREDPLEDRIVRLTSETLALLLRVGFNPDQARLLLNIVHSRCRNTRDSRYIYECLRQRASWSQNESLIPQSYRRRWSLDKISDVHGGFRIGQLEGPWSDEAMSKACDILGQLHFKVGLAESRAGFVAEACVFLEIAVLYGSDLAATHLVNILNDPVSAEMVASSGLQTDKKEALSLINTSVTSGGDISPYVILTHLSEACSPAKIGRQTSKQLEGGLAMLADVSNPPGKIVLEKLAVYEQYPSPSKIKLQIVDHCLGRGIQLPSFPREKLIQLRQRLLEKLANENDPAAAMIMLARDNGPEVYSHDWERLLMAAAGGGNGHALWLLGLHHMRKEGVFPITSDTKAKLEGSLGFEYACLSIMALHETPNRMVSYTLALAALCRAAGDIKRGFLILANSMNEALDRPDFPRDTYRLLDGNYKDWDIKDPNHKAYWGEEKCGRLLEQYFDPHSKNMQTALNVYRS